VGSVGGLVYSNIYWLNISLPGRLGIAARPRGNDWLEDEIRIWGNSGVEIIISALTPVEEMELGLGYERQVCHNNGIEYISLPIPDRQTPSSNSLFLNKLDRLAQHLRDGKWLVIHCRMGVGRASLLAATILTLCGIAVDDAFAAIEQARGCSVPDTPAQREWVRNFAAMRRIY
jgi:hypothetical protein